MVFDAQNIILPRFLDPILSYLSDTLPSPLYSFLINILSHSLALFTALLTLVTSLLSKNPLEWDAQTVLPPLITVFAAYLALLSFYRTTTWMIRTSVWFVKWGTILGALTAGAGYFMGNANGNGVGNYGVVSTLGGFLLDMINGQGQNAAGGSRSKSRTQKSRTRSKPLNKKKPKAWEPFERHREWQQQENRVGADDLNDAQKIISDIVGAAGRIVSESGWWNVVKRVAEFGGSEGAHSKRGGEQEVPPEKAKAKAGSSRSR